MDISTFNKPGYEPFVPTAREGERENGCITNTVQQATAAPQCITVPVSQTQSAHDPSSPVPAHSKRKGWICTECGYIYEGETLPAEYVCPICKHPSSDFEAIEE